jgi:hypothetical protein
MGKVLPPKENELYQRTDEVLHYLWDPIGVAGAPGARDEYWAYLPHVFALLMERGDERAIADYLVSVERESMGLRGRPEKALEVARKLIEYRAWVLDRAS